MSPITSGFFFLLINQLFINTFSFFLVKSKKAPRDKFNLFRFLKYLWASSRCSDSIPAEADVWLCYFRLSGDSEDNSGKRKPSFCL